MGGRGSSSASSRAVGSTVPVMTAQMPVGRPISAAQLSQNQAQAASQNAAPPQVIASGDISQADLQRLVDNQHDYMQQNPDADIARSLYISAATDSAGFSMSQTLNHKLENGGALNGNEAFIYDNLRGAMQPLGADVMLNRGAHASVVRALGVSDWSQMSAAQLKSSLVGKSWTSNSFTSASYDESKNPFFHGPFSGGREVVLRMHTAKSANVMLGARKQAEVVLDIGSHFQVTDVGFTGQTATPRNGRPTKQIVIDVDVW